MDRKLTTRRVGTNSDQGLTGTPRSQCTTGKHINKILSQYLVERIVHRGTVDGKVVLLCRQADDIAVNAYRRSILLDCNPNHLASSTVLPDVLE